LTNHLKNVILDVKVWEARKEKEVMKNGFNPSSRGRSWFGCVS